jgi:hypothetical protein
MYENLQVISWLWHISFAALCFGTWHQFVGLKLEERSDFLIPIIFITLGQLAFAFIVLGVPIRWLNVKLRTRKQPKWKKKYYWSYQVENDWVGGVLAWVGYWFGIFAATYATVIS